MERSLDEAERNKSVKSYFGMVDRRFTNFACIKDKQLENS